MLHVFFTLQIFTYIFAHTFPCLHLGQSACALKNVIKYGHHKSAQVIGSELINLSVSSLNSS